nr:immunoglobulin light chain junction region [Macaca mulatta]MOW67274.1 immunoglobulin light chain junction region [Macaca mulatta]
DYYCVMWHNNAWLF